MIRQAMHVIRAISGYYFEAATVVVLSLLAVPEIRADAPPNRYEIDDATVRDTKTGLVWQRHVGESSMGQPAEAYCSSLSVAGGGWRAPTLKELLTLVDPTRVNPAMDPTAFGATTSSCCRSRQTYLSQGQFPQVTFHLGVNMQYGTSGNCSTSMLVRCVR